MPVELGENPNEAFERRDHRGPEKHAVSLRSHASALQIVLDLGLHRGCLVDDEPALLPAHRRAFVEKDRQGRLERMSQIADLRS